MDFLTGKMHWRKRKHFKSTNRLIRTWKNKGFSVIYKNALCALSRRWFLSTIGTWIGFFFLSLLGKIIKFYKYINIILVKNETCEFLQNSCTDFLVDFQLELLGCLLCFPKKKENSPCRNLETPSRSQVDSQNKPSISISSCHRNNIKVLK